MTAPRICFVIMPFSATSSCTEEQWTAIFEEMIKPAVEEAGIGYQCVRSSANRGNIIGQILRALNDAHVVIADLTDRNPNVFYELGVRHTLTDRTILISQDIEAIPFDLRPYACHVYDWRSEEGKRRFRSQIKLLLEEVDESPDRPDNPVSDFLGRRATIQRDPAPPVPADPSSELSLAGPQSEYVDATSLARQIARGQDTQLLRRTVRSTRGWLHDVWREKSRRLNSAVKLSSMNEPEVFEKCYPIVAEFDSDISKLEEFGLAFVEAEYTEGLHALFPILEDFISMSERPPPGSSLRPVTGAPATIALRLLLNWSAKSVEQGSLDLYRILVDSPLQTLDLSNKATSQPLVERGHLFYSEAFLGYANHTAKYLAESGWKNEALRSFFTRQEEYLQALVVAILLTDLVFLARHSGEEAWIYPTYRLIPNHQEGLARFVDRLRRSMDMQRQLAGIIGESLEEFRSQWPARAKRINEARLGGDRDLLLSITGYRIPDSL